MKKYEFVRDLDRTNDFVSQTLWKLKVPVEFVKTYDVTGHPVWENSEFVVVSVSEIPELIMMQGCGETYIFPSDENGEFLSYCELSGSQRGVVSPTVVLDSLVSE